GDKLRQIGLTRDKTPNILNFEDLATIQLNLSNIKVVNVELEAEKLTIEEEMMVDEKIDVRLEFAEMNESYYRGRNDVRREIDVWLEFAEDE
ncbi:7191_t:CDS:2, partial [Racocetra persica]